MKQILNYVSVVTKLSKHGVPTFCSPFHTLLGYNICFQNCVASNVTKLESDKQTGVYIVVVDFKQPFPFPNKYTILMLHIIPNRKLHTSSFEMGYNVAVCVVDLLNSNKNWLWPLCCGN